MIVFWFILDGIAGLLLALAVLSFIRIYQTSKYAYRYKGVVIESGFSGNQFNYKVQLEIDGKPEVRSVTLNVNLPKSESGRLRYAEAFSRTFAKGRFVDLVAKNKEATDGLRKRDFPLISLIFFSLLVVIFHTTAYLTGNGFLFSV